jgi:hypothetical protein
VEFTIILFLCFSAPFYSLINRDHNSDSMVYIDRAWIARINVESSSLNIYFPDAIFFLIANINLSSTTINVVRPVGIIEGEFYNNCNW